MDPTTAAVIAIIIAAASEILALNPKTKANGLIQAALLAGRTLFPKRKP